MSYAEFPGTCMGDGDKGHAELIALYKELVSKYSETLGMITEVNNRLTAYENTMNQRVAAAVTPAVNTAVGSYKNDTDSKIAALAADNTNIRNLIAQNDINIRNDMLSLESDVFTAINTVDAKVNSTASSLTQSNNSLNNRIDSEVLKLNTELRTGIERLEEETSDAIEQEREFTVRLISIIEKKFTDEISQIRDETSANSIRWLWQHGCDGGGFNAIEWYFATNISCEDWQSLSPTADDWYTMGRYLFRRFDQSNKMFDPVTGLLSDVRRVIENLSIIIKDDAITADEYDKRKITAGQYNALNEKAFCYDWKGDKNVQ